MPAEQSVREQTKAFFGNIWGKKSKQLDRTPEDKDEASNTAEILERSLPKDDPLLESNTFNKSEEDVDRKNSKNKRREEESNGQFDDENKENVEDEDDKVGEEKESASVVNPPVPSPVPAKRKKRKGFKLPWTKDERNASQKTSHESDNIEMEERQQEDASLANAPIEETAWINEVPSTSNEVTEGEYLPSTSNHPPQQDEETKSTKEIFSSTPDDPNITPVPQPRNIPAPSLSDTVADETTTYTKPSTARRKRRKRGSRKPRHDAEDTVDTTVVDDSIPAPSTPPAFEEEALAPRDNVPEDNGLVLGVTIHHTDHLQADLKYMTHPVVRVSIVDGSTGSYLPKTTRSRRVTSYYETENVTTVLPIMTQPFDFRANQSVLPRWEENLIFNESFQSMVRLKNLQDLSADPEAPPIDLNIKAPSPILFFVVRDFVSMAKANNKRRGRDDTEQGWHNIAWAFLKLVGANEKPNIGHRVRLQLYYPPRHSTLTHTDSQSEPAYFWWREHVRQTYPSTLYVTLKAVNRPGEMHPACRSMFATQPEIGVQSYNQLHQSLEFADQSIAVDKEEKPRWSRLPGQTCKVPNVVSSRLWSGTDGAFTIRFSNGGTRLAVACKYSSSYPILLYGIPHGEEMGALNGHQQLVYDIHWSNNDEKVVSSSGDGTAQVWDLSDKSKSTHTLPHPAYVYTAAFHPSAQYLIATGGYDSVIRVWSIATSTAQMLQELVGHRSFINSLAFDFSSLNLYSVDSSGLIVSWNCHSHERPKKNIRTTWSLKNKFDERELKDICINSVQVHPGNNKLLLHCRDSTVRMFDVRIHTLVSYNGAVNHRQLIRSTLTPCGSFVVSGSEDGCAYVWNADSGDQVAIYNELGYSRPVRDIAFHPHDHVVAFCSFHPNMPVLVFKYDKDATSVSGGVISVVGSTPAPASKAEIDQADSHRLTDTSRPGLKVERIRRHLDSVLGSLPPRDSPRGKMATPGMRNQYLPSSRYDQYGSYGPNNTLSTWGSTFDSTHASILEPSYMSPHASPETRLMAQHLAANQRRVDDNTQGWRPTFAAVGGSPYRSELNSSMGPDVSFAIDEEGKKVLQVTSTPGSKPQHTVVALYDYQANRSDELTMMRGDVIKVLYKDSATWWFGEQTSDGTQGYFPTNYVQIRGNEVEEEVKPETSPEAMFGVPSDRPDSAESEKEKSVHALKMLSGKVHFYSQSESDGDEEKLASISVSSRQRRRSQRTEKSAPSTPSTSTQATPVPRSRSTLNNTSSKPPRQLSPTTGDSPSTRALPTLPSPRNKKTKSTPIPVDETVIEREAAIVEVTPKPRKTKPKKSKDRSKSKTTGDSKKKVVVKDVEESLNHDDTTIVAQQPQEEQSDLFPTRPRFGVLKAVQAKMAENDSSFSRTVLGGSEYPSVSRVSTLAPILTSTATKSKKSRSRANRSTSRGRMPKVLVTQPSQDSDDGIPMLELDDGTTESGVQNLAYDGTSEV
ncbi:unnamed protein product [Clavelina lepadiformis]|uniref:SH3 domain-containing protein n=1 Tax=Clavelina lepadiformis TaxID=159417 RepID=A0ABP0GHD9_CLALP